MGVNHKNAANEERLLVPTLAWAMPTCHDCTLIWQGFFMIGRYRAADNLHSTMFEQRKTVAGAALSLSLSRSMRLASGQGWNGGAPFLLVTFVRTPSPILTGLDLWRCRGRSRSPFELHPPPAENHRGPICTSNNRERSVRQSVSLDIPPDSN